MAQHQAPTTQPAAQPTPQPAQTPQPGVPPQAAGGMSSAEELMLLSGKSGYQQQAAAVRPGTYGDSPTTPTGPNRRGIATYQRNQANADTSSQIDAIRPQVTAARAAVAAAEDAIASTPLLDAAKDLVVDQALEHMGEVGDVISKLQSAKEFVDHVATLLDSQAGQEAHGEAVKGIAMQIVGEIPVISSILGALQTTLEVADALEKKAQAQQQIAALRAHATTVSGQLRQLELELGRLEGRTGMNVNVQA